MQDLSGAAQRDPRIKHRTRSPAGTFSLRAVREIPSQRHVTQVARQDGDQAVQLPDHSAPGFIRQLFLDRHGGGDMTRAWARKSPKTGAIVATGHQLVNPPRRARGFGAGDTVGLDRGRCLYLRETAIQECPDRGEDVDRIINAVPAARSPGGSAAGPGRQ